MARPLSRGDLYEVLLVVLAFLFAVLAVAR